MDVSVSGSVGRGTPLVYAPPAAHGTAAPAAHAANALPPPTKPAEAEPLAAQPAAAEPTLTHFGAARHALPAAPARSDRATSAPAPAPPSAARTSPPTPAPAEVADDLWHLPPNIRYAPSPAPHDATLEPVFSEPPIDLSA